MSAEEEQRHIDAVKTRLAVTFSAVTPERIDETVTAELSRFDQGKVRDFVPLLVERAATARLLAI